MRMRIIDHDNNQNQDHDQDKNHDQDHYQGHDHYQDHDFNQKAKRTGSGSRLSKKWGAPASIQTFSEDEDH